METNKLNCDKEIKHLHRTVCAFDFDGTLTTKDTLLEFIKYCVGPWRFWMGMLRHTPLLMLMLCDLYPNDQCKEKVLGYFFRGMRQEDFRQKGEAFASHIDQMLRPETMTALREHVAQGHTVYVVSASIDEWVRPWCHQHGVPRVLATQIEIDANGMLTGHLATPNCYGAEKRRRLLGVEPDKHHYHLIVYGDSRGDKELMDMADEKHWIKR